MARKATEDTEGMIKAMQKMKHRKATRQGDIPAELWKLLVCEGRTEDRRTRRKEEREVSEVVRLELWRIAAKARKEGRPPVQFHHNVVWQVDKHSGKKGCASQRLVHGVTTAGKAYNKSIFMQQRFIFLHTNMVALLMFVSTFFTHSVWVQLWVSLFACVVMLTSLHSYTRRDPVNPNPIDADRRGGKPLPADAQVLGELEQHGISAEKTAQEILEGKHSANTATYFLLLQRERTPAGR